MTSFLIGKIEALSELDDDLTGSLLLTLCVHAKSRKSCPTLCDPVDCSPPSSSDDGNSPGKNTGVGCHALLQRISPIQGSNRISNVSCIGGRILYH